MSDEKFLAWFLKSNKISDKQLKCDHDWIKSTFCYTYCGTCDLRVSVHHSMEDSWKTWNACKEAYGIEEKGDE